MELNRIIAIKAVRARRDARMPVNLPSADAASRPECFTRSHVPVESIGRLLKEKPAIRRIALPRKPQAYSGVEGEKRQTFTICAIGTKHDKVFAVD